MSGSNRIPVAGVPKLGEILLEKGFLTSGDLSKALKLQEERIDQGETILLGQLLTEMGLISYPALYHALDEQISWLTRELENKYNQTSIITDLSTCILGADNKQDIIAIINNNLPAVDHISLLHLFDDDPASQESRTSPGTSSHQDSILFDQETKLWKDFSRVDFEPYLAPGEVLLMSGENRNPQDPSLYEKFGERFGFQSIAFIPVYVFEKLAGFIFVGSREEDLVLPSLQYQIRIAQLTATGLERVAELEGKDRNLKILEILDRVGQAISLETDLKQLYPIIHQQVNEVMGEVDFLIATYDQKSDMIEIPYAFEDGKTISLPSFPLGEGLTSILIRERQPLMLNEDTQARAMELGAKIVGLPARSWLGVPLLISGEPTGAIVVQDTKQEHRFNATDQRLLTSLASQVAVAIHNAFLFQEIREKSKQERVMADLTSSVWSSPDLETILQNALAELGKNLDVDEGLIELEPFDTHSGSDW